MAWGLWSQHAEIPNALTGKQQKGTTKRERGYASIQSCARVPLREYKLCRARSYSQKTEQRPQLRFAAGRVRNS